MHPKWRLRYKSTNGTPCHVVSSHRYDLSPLWMTTWALESLLQRTVESARPLLCMLMHLLLRRPLPSSSSPSKISLHVHRRGGQCLFCTLKLTHSCRNHHNAYDHAHRHSVCACVFGEGWGPRWNALNPFATQLLIYVSALWSLRRNRGFEVEYHHLGPGQQQVCFLPVSYRLQ